MSYSNYKEFEDPAKHCVREEQSLAGGPSGRPPSAAPAHRELGILPPTIILSPSLPFAWLPFACSLEASIVENKKACHSVVRHSLRGL
jgi:hypothetical protein